MTSYVLSLDKKEASAYLLVFVVIKIVFGITNAVFFSGAVVSCVGMAGYDSRARVMTKVSENRD